MTYTDISNDSDTLTFLTRFNKSCKRKVERRSSLVLPIAAQALRIQGLVGRSRISSDVALEGSHGVPMLACRRRENVLAAN